jgi:hypothetical protein
MNFIGGGVTAADNAGQTRTDVTIWAPWVDEANVVYITSATSGGIDAGLAALPTHVAGEYRMVIAGPGDYYADEFKFDGFDETIVRGQGRETVVHATPSAQGTAPNFWPNSVNFSGNTKCGLESMTIIYDDTNAVTEGVTAVEQGAIMRASNNALFNCWMRDLEIRVENLHTSRTANGAFVNGIGYLVGGWDTEQSGTIYACICERVDIISESCGLRSSDGEWHYHDCNIFFGASQNTDTPLMIGLDWMRGGRTYWWGGKITTGYDQKDPISDAAVYGVRCNQSTAGGRLNLFNTIIFARSEKTTATYPKVRAVYMNGTLSDPWIRITGSYLQAESLNNGDEPAVETDWDPVTDANGGNRLQVDNNIRISGCDGNVLGNDGQVFVTASVTLTSNYNANYWVDSTSGAVNLTLHSNWPINNDTSNIKHYAGSNTVTLLTNAAEADKLNGVTDGSMIIPLGGSLAVRGAGDDGSGNILFETLMENWVTAYETHTWAIVGAVADATPVAPGFTVYVGANETVTVHKVYGRTSVGTVTVQVQDDGTNVTGATCSASSGGASSSDLAVAVASGSYMELDTSSGASSPADLSCTLVLKRISLPA